MKNMASQEAIIMFILSCALLPSSLVAKKTEGTIQPSDSNDRSDWIFLTRFCFLSDVGKMQYNLEYPKDYAIENLLFYYDVPGQWDAVYKRGLNCTQKVAALNNNNIFSLVTSNGLCTLEDREGREWYSCTGSMDFSSSRERWWYVTLSRCNQPLNTQVNALYLNYKLHMTNGDDLLHKEFSADEFYILLVDIIFFILYIKIMVLTIVFAVILVNRQLLHTTYKLFMSSVTLWTVHLLCMVIAWGSYGNTGWEMPRLEVLGRIIAAASNIIFILMLILLAKGYTIVRGRLTNKAMIKITSFIFMYVVTSVALFIWEGAMFDEGLVLYYYESPPGYCMVAIILLGWLWFTKAAVFTLKHYKAKTNFYIIFYTIYTIWFWASPVIILIAMFSMAKWTREKTVNGVQQFIAYIGHLTFLILTMPNKVNTNFPFHIKTTQIGLMQDGDGLTGDDSARTADGSTRGSGTPGAYALSSGAYDSGTGPNLSFFITSKAGSNQDDGARVYAPLDVNSMNLFHSEGSTPPPAYSQTDRVMPSAPSPEHQQGHVNPAYCNNSGMEETNYSSNTPTNNNNDNYNINNNSNNRSLPPDNINTAQLPPLRRALGGDNDVIERATTLPPIRGTGLPPIGASTMQEGGKEEEGNEAQPKSQPPDYADYDMFRAGKY